MPSDALRAYLIKNYASKPSPNTKIKKKKKKRKKKDRVFHHQQPVEERSLPITRPVITDHDITAMPNLNDGSGWNQPTKSSSPSNPILASQHGKRKRDSEREESVPSSPTKRIRKIRYDTDSDEESEQNQVVHSSSTKRVRHDTSDEDDSDIEATRRRPMSPDSDSDLDVDRKPLSSGSIKHESTNDSDSDIEVPRRPTNALKKEEVDGRRRKKLNALNGNETVYRDKKGKRITADEYNAMRDKNKKKEHDEMEWSSGLVQKYKAFESQAIAQRQRYQGLARYRDDAEMNVDLQNEKRAEDPLNQMEGYKGKDIGDTKGMIDGEGGDGMNQRPMYKGKPWVNRYGILPGYRWDGVDRSNGFEQKKLLHQSRNKDLKKKRYKWANEDM